LIGQLRRDVIGRLSVTRATCFAALLENEFKSVKVVERFYPNE